MVNSETGALLWSPCTTAVTSSTGGDDDNDDVDNGWRTSTIVLIVIGALVLAAYKTRQCRAVPHAALKSVTVVNQFQNDKLATAEDAKE
jgi:hypothetical protein